jgi:hypothetical protein
VWYVDAVLAPSGTKFITVGSGLKVGRRKLSQIQARCGAIYENEMTREVYMQVVVNQLDFLITQQILEMIFYML